MKSCPFCNAVLTDEANFCIYCMTSLDEKKKTHPIKRKKKIILPVILILTAVILASVLSSIILIGHKSDNKEQISEEDPISVDSETAHPESIYPEILYTYRPAVIGDDYSSAYIPTEKDIIITGIKKAEASGIYFIPEQIDGKRVLGIDPLAFSDEKVCETVKKVIVADNIKTVWNNAFASCVNMSDIYLMGEAVYIDTAAFSQKRNGSLTIHCSETCDDRNFRLYKNNAEGYGAEYEYWDGGVVS